MTDRRIASRRRPLMVSARRFPDHRSKVGIGRRPSIRSAPPPPGTVRLHQPSGTTWVLPIGQSYGPTFAGDPNIPMNSTVFGTPGRTRTCGLLLRRQALYPLSYGRILLLQYRRRWPAPTTPTPASLIGQAPGVSPAYVHCAGGERTATMAVTMVHPPTRNRGHASFDAFHHQHVMGRAQGPCFEHSE